MPMKEFVPLICPIHQKPLTRQNDTDYSCPKGCKYPINYSIPRFVPLKNYAESFGLQWNKFRQTQLDSFTHTHISRDRLTRLFDGDLSIVKDKMILECGCGAGRFTEILLSEGARVFAIDISSAVEANYETCKDFENYFVCQADIYGLPVEHDRFDIVCCIGVIQHTPDSERTIQTLCSYVKPGGLLVIDHYTYGYPETPVRKGIRKILVHCFSEYSLKMVKMITSVFWPVHSFLWKYNQNIVIQKLRQVFLFLSPVVDYHEAYPTLDENLLKVWALLDTHDTLTDVYKHLRSAEEIFSYLEKCGMISIKTYYAGNGVEARAIKPLK